MTDSKQEEMPPLPEPEAEYIHDGWNYPADAFTADQMRSYAAQCVREAVEREREMCARIAEDMDYGMGEIAAAIREQK
jgi:hypothetical protein